MTILFGHPTGNPNSHHAALAHFEAGRLEAFCVPWMPSTFTLRSLRGFGPLRPFSERLSRRHFDRLADAPKVQGRAGEFRRLLTRALGFGDERLSYEANDWLMRAMRSECSRPSVRAVHSYEDCSLWQFEEARRLGKACIYDMPIGYYPAWEQTQTQLAREFADWLPEHGLPSTRYVRRDQKRLEMDLADLVLVPSKFVEATIRKFHPNKNLSRAAYGVDSEFWVPPSERTRRGPMRFIYAGQLSVRKGTPLLLEAWRSAALHDAVLELVGMWQLDLKKRFALPSGVTYKPSCSREELRARYHAADVFVFPSFFEGFGLVLLEAMACGLPVVATEASAGPELLTGENGLLIATGDRDALIEGLRWFSSHRDALPEMRRHARATAERFTWENYRRAVTDSVAPYV